ncbi:hypothetical protein Q3G72_031827 [Acer saccharum]|nr:hypothetical protein Q3G72_031827 [Acer saccharum]
MSAGRIAKWGDSQVGGLPEGQVGLQHSIEPCTNLMRTNVAINVLGGDKISEINFKVGKEKQVQAAKGLTGVNDSRPTSGLVLKSDIADPSFLASSSSSTNLLRKEITSVKWKRAARTKGGNSDLGVNSSLGKRGSSVLGEGIPSNAKKARDGSVECGDFSLVSTDSVDIVVVRGDAAAGLGIDNLQI